MNRDPNAWARLGKALKTARLTRGLDQAELATLADVSTASVQSAEAGTVPKARMPYTLYAIAKALDWPAGAVEAVLDGADPTEGWQNISVQPAITAERLETILSAAMVRASDNVTPAEIRAATKIALDELRREGLLPETDGVQL
ncbi:helix-turn-helix domain-containing protein [Streptomyces virginiae]|uniref:helix-turn-helix domain-containing protein n=1 Tax=Streptomyces virginiae TaxID=1961 RepID=UPI0035E1C86E